MFLNNLNLPKAWQPQDCFLRLNINHRERLYEEAKRTTHEGRFTRYRDFLLIFDDDMPIGLLYVGSIFELICELEENLKMTGLLLKESQTLSYLKANRFKTS